MTIDRGALVGVATGSPPVAYVRQFAARGFDVTVDDMVGQSREYPLVEYRQVAMTAVRRLTKLSFPAIGREFGNRDHTTVMHAVSKIEQGKHHPAGSKRRRLWETADALCDEVRRQWAVDTGRVFPDPGQMDMDALAANAAPSVVFS